MIVEECSSLELVNSQASRFPFGPPPPAIVPERAAKQVHRPQPLETESLIKMDCSLVGLENHEEYLPALCQMDLKQRYRYSTCNAPPKSSHLL